MVRNISSVKNKRIKFHCKCLPRRVFKEKVDHSQVSVFACLHQAGRPLEVKLLVERLWGCFRCVDDKIRIGTSSHQPGSNGCLPTTDGVVEGCLSATKGEHKNAWLTHKFAPVASISLITCCSKSRRRSGGAMSRPPPARRSPSRLSILISGPETQRIVWWVNERSG